MKNKILGKVIVFGTIIVTLVFLYQRQVGAAPQVFISTPATSTPIQDFSLTVGTSTPLTFYGSTTLAVYGSTTIQTWLNTLYAFRVINAASTTVFTIDTVNSRASTTNLVISNINGSTQCLQINSAGLVSGTGSGCASALSGGSLNALTYWTSASAISATSSQPLYVGSVYATSTAATSTLLGGLVVDTNSLVVDYSTNNIGIGSTSPWGLLSVNGSGIGTIPQFTIGSSTKTDFVVTNSGNVGIGTTSPGSLLSLGSLANFTTATSTFYGTGGLNLAGGCFAINGTCAGGGGTPGGSDTQVQFNNASAFGGMAEFTYISPTFTISSAGILNASGALTFRIPTSASSTLGGLDGNIEIDTTDDALHFYSGTQFVSLPGEKCFGAGFQSIADGEYAPLNAGFNLPFTVTEVKTKADITATTTGRGASGGYVAYSGYGWLFHITHGANSNSTSTVTSAALSTATSTFTSFTTGFNDSTAAADEQWWVHVTSASSTADIGTSTVTLVAKVCGFFDPSP